MAQHPMRPTWLEIDQAALENNTQLLRTIIGPNRHPRTHSRTGLHATLASIRSCSPQCHFDDL